MLGKGAPTEPGNRTVEKCHTHAERCQHIGGPHPAGVVQVRTNASIGHQIAHLSDHATYGFRVCPTYSIGQVNRGHWHVQVGGQISNETHIFEHPLHGHFALIITAERSEYVRFIKTYSRIKIQLSPSTLTLTLLSCLTVVVLQTEGVGRVEHQLSIEIDTGS